MIAIDLRPRLSPRFVTMLSAFLGLALGSLALAFGEENPAASAHNEFLEKLQARDAKFDNVHLVFITRAKLPGELRAPAPDAGEPQPETPHDARIVFRSEVTVRGVEWTSSGDVIERPEAAEGAAVIPQHTKLSVAGGKLTMLFVDEKAHPEGSASIQKLTPQLEDTAGQSMRMTSFAMGFGFGRHIRDIERLDADGAGHTLTATMDIEPHSRCTLSLDSDLVVRHATIELADGRIDVTTKGTKLVDGFLFAETGRVRISHEKLKIEEDYFVIFQEAQFNLTDERYRELATIEIPKNAIVTNLDELPSRPQQALPVKQADQ